MANAVKISQLTTASPLNGAELVPVVQNGGTVQTAVSTLALFATSTLSSEIAQVSSRLDQVAASVSAINSVLASINVSALTALASDVSALEVRVSTVSAAVSVNTASITSINAVVSTKVNRVGDFMDAVQYIEFDTSTVISTSVGRLHWDIEYGTLDIGLAGGNSNVLIGQREVMYVYNDTAATLTKGKVVEVTGAQGQRLTVKLAQADNDANSATVLGIMLETVSVNASGYVATNGIVRNVDTGAFTDGQIIYLSPVSAGEITATKPVAPQHMVMMGYVVKGGSVGAGSIYVKTQNGYELGELHDVKTSSSASIANNEVIAWNTSAGVFTNSTVLIEAQASISVLQLQVDAVSAATSVNAVHIAAVSASVSALQVQLNAVSAVTSVNAAAITSINNVVSALEIRVSTVSAQASAIQSQVNAVSVLVSALDVRITAVSASVSTLQVQVNNVSAALTSTNNVVSALEIRVSTVSTQAAATKTQVDAVSVLVSALTIQVDNVSAALTSTNNVVSALEIRVSTVSAQASAIQSQVNAVSVLVSSLDVRLTAVSASVSVINARLPSGTVVGTTDTQTLTNKRISPRAFTTTTGVSVTPDIGSFDIYIYTALASDLSINTATSSTPANGDKLIFRFKDNGVSRLLAWASVGSGSYRPVGITLPTATSAGKVTYVGCIYNATESYWDAVAVATQA